MTHKQWIMSQPCLVHGHNCAPVVAHHVRTAANSGVGLKPDDSWCIPLCDELHKEGHQKGWKTFERKYGVDLKAIAVALAARSPALREVVLREPR